MTPSARGHQLDASEAQVLVEPCHVLLITAEAVERLGNHDVEAAGAGVLEQPLIPRPQGAGAGDRGVAVDLGVVTCEISSLERLYTLPVKSASAIPVSRSFAPLKVNSCSEPSLRTSVP